jgi:pyruvate dehydrogenase E2 component (dihydrolipoamide acetyltransferase)
MAELREVQVPDIGDFDQVAVTEVLVKPGDRIEVEAPLITLESDKATMDVPSPWAGTVKEVRLAAGAKVGKGAPILTLEVDEAAEKPSPAPPAPTPEQPAAPPPVPEKAPSPGPPTPEQPPRAPERAPPPPPQPRQPPQPPQPIDEAAFAKAYASPAVRRFARELGVDLGRLRGTGRAGRIVREDVQGFVKAAMSGGSGGAGAAGGFALPEMPRIDFAKFGEIEERPLGRIKLLTAKNVHRSWLHVPHVTQHDEADITELEAFRKEHAEEAQAQGFKLTPLVFIMKACVAALRAHPEVNSSLSPSGDSLILKKYFHIGIAVDTPEGLVVPVVRDVDRKGIFDLARELAEVSARARGKKLKLDDLQGGCFTISSLGGIGGTAFTPIVNAPEVAILGVSKSRQRPVWSGSEFAPRLMLPLSLSYDHRVIDGAQAARFTTVLCETLADLRKILL